MYIFVGLNRGIMARAIIQLQVGTDLFKRRLAFSPKSNAFENWVFFKPQMPPVPRRRLLAIIITSIG